MRVLPFLLTFEVAIEKVPSSGRQLDVALLELRWHYYLID